MSFFPQSDPVDTKNWESIPALDREGVFRAWLSSPGNALSVAHGGACAFDSVDYNYENYYNPVGNKYIAKRAGIYRFSWHAIGPTTMPNDYYFLAVCRVTRNNVMIREADGQLGQSNTASGGGSPRTSGTCQHKLQPNDEVTVNIYNATGGTIGILGGDPGYTYFEGELICRL